MSQFEVSMLLKLVDQISGPLRGIVTEMEALKKATGSPVSGNAGAGFRAQTQGAERVVGVLKQVKAATEGAKAATTGLVTAQEDLGKSEAVVTGISRQTQALRQAGQAASGYQEKLSRLESHMANAGMISMGFQQMRGMGAAIKRPVQAAVTTYADLQAQATSIAIASDRNNLGPQIAENIIKVATASHLSIADIAQGERSLASTGGAKYLEKLTPLQIAKSMKAIRPVEPDLAKLAFASGTNTSDIYQVMLNLMRLGKMSAPQALRATQRMYVQGKQGPLELRNMAAELPGILAAATGFGETGPQFVKNMTPFLQTLRMQFPSAAEASTAFQRLAMQLPTKRYQKSIHTALGVSVPDVMATATKGGHDPLKAVLDALADAYDKKVKGGANPAVLKAQLGNGIYFSRSIANWLAHRKEFPEYQIPGDKGKTATEADSATRSKTQAALDQDNATAKLALAYETGSSQQGLLTTATKLQTTALQQLTGVVKAHPVMTSVAGGASYLGGSALQGMGGVGGTAASLFMGWRSLQWAGLKLGLTGGGEAATAGAGAAEAATAGAVAAETALGVEATAAAGGLAALVAPLALIVAPLLALGAALAWLKGKTDQYHAKTFGEKAADAKTKAETLAKQIKNYPADGGLKQKHALELQHSAVVAGIQATNDYHKEYPYARGRGGVPGPSTDGKSHLPQIVKIAPPPPPVVNLTTQAPVTITNHITINATTNASPAAIGGAVAGAAARGTKAGMGALHDGPESLGHH